MIGYKNDKYIYFGRVAARVDDVLNYIPARICALLFIAAAACLGYDAKGAWRIMRRDASKHPSPNGGYAEATVAGALGIRLGGHNRYFGKDTFRDIWAMPTMNWNRSISARPRISCTAYPWQPVSLRRSFI